MLYYLQNYIILYKVSKLIVVIYRWLQKYVQVTRLMASDHIAFCVACNHIDFV